MKEYFGYSGKVCVITGSASGIAKAATEMLVDLGAEVYALDWSDVAIAGIKKYIRTDLSDRSSIDKAFTEIPEKIDKYFGVAGLSGQKTDYNKTFTVNFIANKYITEKYLKERLVDGGAIAYITSSAGLRWEKFQGEYSGIVDADGWDASVEALEALGKKDVPGAAAYMLSKRALNSYAILQVPFFAQKKSRVNVVMPASTDTGMKDEFAQSVGGIDNLIMYTGYAHRLAESREMAEPLVFVNSSMASYINGQELVVDFGSEANIKIGIQPDYFNTTAL